MLPEQQQRILGYFIEEAKDHLNTIEQGLLALQNTIDDPEMLKEVYRAAHSIKGGAGMLGLSSIQKTSHLLEDCFKILEGSPVRVDQKLESLFLRVFDTLQSLIEQLQGPFGLTEDVAASLMSTTAPVFSELQQHLEVLTKQPVGGVKVPAVAAAAKEKDQIQVAFKQEVMEHLRQMLQLFKPPQWPNSREDLVSRCRQLQELGSRFNLPGWSELLSCAGRAIANPDNSSQTLAPIVIKEIKQAQELVLAGREAEVAVSSQLAALAPPAPTPEAAIESDLVDLLAVTGDSDDSEDWFQSALAQAPADALGDGVASEPPEGAIDFGANAWEPGDDAAQFFWVPDTDVTPAKTTARSDRPEKPIVTAPADPTGPEVGAAELMALNDLFPEEVPELDSTWQVEEVLGDAQSEPMLESFDDFNAATDNELADLFAQTYTASPDDSPEDDTVTLFGKAFFDDESEVSPIPPQGEAAAANRLTAHLFDEDFSATGTPASRSDEDISLFGEKFGFDDDSTSDRVAFQGEGEAESALTDLFEEDFPAVETGATSQDEEDLSLFGEDLFFQDSPAEQIRASSPSAAAASEPEADDLSELFAGLNEDDFWQAELANESEALDLARSQSADISNLDDSNWLEGWDNAAIAGQVPDELDMAGFEPSAPADDWQGELFTAREESSPAAGSALSDRAPIELNREDSPSDLEALTPALSFGEVDFGFNSPEDEAAMLLGDESELMGLEAINQNWADQIEGDAKAVEFGALTDDFDWDANDLFGSQAAAGETPSAQSIVSAPEVGSKPTRDYPSPQNAEASIDDFFSLDEPSQLWGEPSQTEADLGLDANWLLASSDLFADMETPPAQDAEIQARISDGGEGEFDLFADEPGTEFDLFGNETPAEEEAFEIADNATAEELLSFDFPSAESETGADDDDLAWLSEITQDVDAESDLAQQEHEENTEEGVVNLTEGEEQFSFEQLAFAETTTTTEGEEQFSFEQLAFAETTTTAELEPEPDFADLDAMLGEVGDIGATGVGSSTPSAELDFADLEAILGEAGDIGATGVSSSTPSAELDFADLEAMLGEEAIAPSGADMTLDTMSWMVSAIPGDGKSTPALVPTTDKTQAVAASDEFEDLEAMIASAETLGGPPMKSRPGQANASKPRARIFEQTMKVPVKQLDNLTNLVGELVVNRNSLEQDQERLRQFLDNLLHQVQQLSDVGARMQDLYERSLLESALLASRQSYRFSTTGGDGFGGYSSGSTWDHIEMDRFTPFHTLSQEMIELIVRVRESASDIEFIVDETDQVSRQFRQVTTQLQEGLTRARMVPFAEIERVFPLFRYVRDKAAELGKQAELRIEGRETLIDKLILEHLSDPMKHLINNGLAHGIEAPEVRQRQGKPPVGRITLSAFHQGNQTVISFSDDGAGIDVELLKAKAVEKRLITAEQANSLSRIEAYELLYLSGLSTKDKADLIAGKGVGMDVVRTNVSEIRGTITTDSTQGKGTSFTIRLPLTLSICKALCCVSNQARIAFPMDGVEDALDVPKSRVQVNAEGNQYIQWRDMQLEFKHLNELLTFNRQLGRGRVYGASKDEDSVAIVVLRSAGNFLAIQVDQVVGEQEIVIKQLEGPVPKPIGIAGATVMGDGRIMPIGDVLELIDIAMGRVGKDRRAMLWEQNNLAAASETPVNEPRVLIVDDSITVRELLSMTFNKAGYRVEQARDGQEAWDKLKSGLPCDIVFCDIEMPRMNGLELLSRLHKDPDLTHLPVAMLTSRGAEKHREMAFDLGASGYFTKPYLEEALLDAASRMLKGEKLVPSNMSAS
jgi:chemosensory pili system protein ChpA (sensor histidine kinase/response regulator)